MNSRLAMDQFLARIEKRAYKMALFKVRDVDEAMDIVQDAMMTLVRKYAMKPEGQWPPLFYRILQNRITDSHRKTSLNARVFGIFRSDDPEQTETDIVQSAPGGYASEPDFQVGMQSAAQKMQCEIERLPERQQQAFLMRAWEGLSVADTADVMRCSQGSVKTHYSRAVHRLRAVLKEDWL